jgi:hypothetical protein
MHPLARIVSLIRADIPVAELDPFRRAGADAYTMIDEAAPASWERLAAWNAFMPQIYGDNLISASEGTGYVAADTAAIVRQLYNLVAAWLQCARQLASNPANTLAFNGPNPLPGWHTRLRSREELLGMRKTLEATHARVASDLQSFAGADEARDKLSTQLVGVESLIETVDTLWVGRRSDELCGAIGDALGSGLDQTHELGQLLSQPTLIDRFLP